jgi:glycosyltransferase involved in cell wall biosynthesis
MNIVYFTSIYYPHESGIQKVIYYLSGFIQQNGHETTVITGDTNIERLKIEFICNVSVIRVPIKNNKFGISMLKDRYDIVTIEQYCESI